MRLKETPTQLEQSSGRSAEILTFVRGAFGLRFEMRFQWEAQWWPVDAQEVGETLASYYSCLNNCLERLCEGNELHSGLACFRLRF
jgi:hypothetical protein